MKIGVITDCLKQPLEQALPTARRLGLDGVQLIRDDGRLQSRSADGGTQSVL